jgi:hypothetical protein
MTTLTSTLHAAWPPAFMASSAPALPASALGACCCSPKAMLSLAPMAVLGAGHRLAGLAGQPRRVAARRPSHAQRRQRWHWGYGIYLLYSLLIAPVMIWLAARALRRPASAPGR